MDKIDRTELPRGRNFPSIRFLAECSVSSFLPNHSIDTTDRFVQTFANCREFGVGPTSNDLICKYLRLALGLRFTRKGCDEEPDAEDHEEGQR
jgi:hypothetical protein